MRTFYVDPEGTARISSEQAETKTPEPEFKTYQHAPRNQYQYRGPFSPPGRVAPAADHAPADPARCVFGLLLWCSPLLLLLFILGPNDKDNPYVYKTAPGGRTVIDEAATARKKQEKLLRDHRRMLATRKPPQYATVEEWQQAQRDSRDTLHLLQASLRERLDSGGNRRWGRLYQQAYEALKKGDRREAARILKIIETERRAKTQWALKVLRSGEKME